MPDSGTYGTKGSGISRRTAMQAIAGAGVVGAAGCLTGDDTDDGTGRFALVRGGDHFDELQWNPHGDPYNTTLTHWNQWVSAELRDYDAELTLLAFDDWEYDEETTISVTLRDDMTFWNGDSYTADDFYSYHEMERISGAVPKDWESIEVTGEYTFDLHIEEPMNPQIVRTGIIPGIYMGVGGEAVWEEWRQTFDDADDDEIDDLLEDLLDFEITTDDLVDDGWGTGAYIIQDITEEYMDLEAYEDHPFHQGNDDRFDPNIENVRIYYAAESGRREQLTVNDDIDTAYHEHNWEDFQDVVGDHWDQTAYGPTGNAYKLLINWRNREYLQDKNVRRAMAAALDYRHIAENTGTYPVEAQSGMAPRYNIDVWGDEVPDGFIEYGVEADYDLADEFLARSGYERDDGTIYDPDGEELEELRMVIGESLWRDTGDVAAHQLEDYGFPIDLSDIDRTTKLETITEQENMSDWDLSTETHFAGNTQHPSEFFWYNTFWGWRLGPADFGPADGWSSFMDEWVGEESHSPYNGKPNEFEVPSDVGVESLEDAASTRDVNLIELVDEVEDPIPDERTNEIIETLSWSWNFHVPDIDLSFAVINDFSNVEDFDWADESEIISYQSMRWPELGVVRHA